MKATHEVHLSQWIKWSEESFGTDWFVPIDLDLSTPLLIRSGYSIVKSEALLWGTHMLPWSQSSCCYCCCYCPRSWRGVAHRLWSPGPESSRWLLGSRNACGTERTCCGSAGDHQRGASASCQKTQKQAMNGTQREHGGHVSVSSSSQMISNFCFFTEFSCILNQTIF